MEITTTIETLQNTASNDISEYTDLIHTYGASAVIIAVFLFILLTVVTFLLRSNQKTNNQLINQQQELVNMLLEKVKETKEEDAQPKVVKEPNLVEMFLNINNNIKDTLHDISEELNSDRIGVYVFHNSVFSSHGLPFFKISCVCEIVKKNSGVFKNLSNQSGLPLQMFDNTISNIYKNGSLIIKDTDNEEDPLVSSCPVLCGMLKNNNIKSATGTVIYDHNNNVMGILMVEYSELKEQCFLEDATEHLVSNAPLLAPVLEFSGIYNTTNK